MILVLLGAARVTISRLLFSVSLEACKIDRLLGRLDPPYSQNRHGLGSVKGHYHPQLQAILLPLHFYPLLSERKQLDHCLHRLPRRPRLLSHLEVLEHLLGCQDVFAVVVASSRKNLFLSYFLKPPKRPIQERSTFLRLYA